MTQIAKEDIAPLPKALTVYSLPLTRRMTHLTPRQQKEEISKAYITAIAARLAYKIGTWSQDDDCLDVTIGAAGILGGGTLASPKLDVQLKCTSEQSRDTGTEISWQLSRKHYDQLRAATVTPKLLVVLMLPENEERWIEYSADELILRRCAYWLSLRGMAPIIGSAESTTVKIPKTNPFSPDIVKTIMEKISRGEDL